jgi:hypothetical protein
MKRRIPVNAAKFQRLVATAAHPVIELDDHNAYLRIGNIEYVTAKPGLQATA